MRFLLLTTSLLMVFLAGCATTKAPSLAERFPNLVEVDPPNRIPYIQQEFSIELVEPILVGKHTALHIQGTLPTGCTKVLRVSDKWLPEILNLEMVGWQKVQESCTQAAIPFSYIFTNMTQEPWEQIKLVTVNGKEFKFHSSTNK